MIEPVRLYSDLLSSMPTCFNLFGPLAVDEQLATAVVHRWFPDLCSSGAHVRLAFEWSPGRRDDRWLGDGTAFDVAIFVDGPQGCTLIGIETKYHEHPVAERRVKFNRRTNRTEERSIKQRYLDVCASLIDEPAVRSDIWATPLEQVWRDHLLALAWQQEQPEQRSAHYVLVAPKANPAWAPLADAYLRVVPGAQASFEYRSIDDLLLSAEDLLPHATLVRVRYLEVAPTPAPAHVAT
jgi:hypothetical protein